MSKVVHFELPADDPKRAIAFYERVFGWTITGWEGPMEYWLVTAGPDDEPGINGAITRRTTAAQATTCSMSSRSVDESAKKVVEAGGSVITPKGAVPGVGYLVMCKDTEGNVFGIIEFDPSAK
jgi:predicted enzyme related to lactoylglutathione lyase